MTGNVVVSCLLGVLVASLCAGPSWRAAGLEVPTPPSPRAALEQANGAEVDTFVILGGYGDLARKYLWRAAFDAWLHRVAAEAARNGSPGAADAAKWAAQGLRKLQFVATGTAAHEDGKERVGELLRVAANCERCEAAMRPYCTPEAVEQFTRSVAYAPTKTPDDYLALNEQLMGLAARMYDATERSRTFFLSLPPSRYPDAIANLAQCRLEAGSTALVLEKPFGTSLDNALQLRAALREHGFSEAQVFLVDHYLTKASVQGIGEIRAFNPLSSPFGRFLSQGHIERVEVVMDEALACEDRALTYAEMGVLRDTFQNHMSEMLAMALAPLLGPDDRREPANVVARVRVDAENATRVALAERRRHGEEVSDDEAEAAVEAAVAEAQATELLRLYGPDGPLRSLTDTEARAWFFDHLQQPALEGDDGAVLGQYSDYPLHVLKEDPEAVPNAAVPTAARVVLRYEFPPFEGVPLVLVGGKQLTHRNTYVRFLVRSPGDEGGAWDMVFSVNGPLGSSFSLSGNHPHEPAVPPGWRRATADDMVRLGESATGRTVFLPSRRDNAYGELFEAALRRSRGMFVSINEAIALWRLWMPLIAEVDARTAPLPRYRNEMGRDDGNGTQWLWEGVPELRGPSSDALKYVVTFVLASAVLALYLRRISQPTYGAEHAAHRRD